MPAATAAAWLLAACGSGESRSEVRDEGEAAVAVVPGAAVSGAVSVDPEPGEWRLSNLRMLTFAGENAEAYWNADGTRLILQATRPGETECDQIFTMDDQGRDLRLVYRVGF